MDTRYNSIFRKMIAGITRVRDESLIIEDTLEHFLGYVDHIFLYDDVSTDNTAEIAESFDKVTVIHGENWRADRVAENTRHRHLLLEFVKLHNAAFGRYEWCLCFDADERLEGTAKEIVRLAEQRKPALPGRSVPDAYRLRLFDGYLTEAKREPYDGNKLAHLDRMYGPEYRDILMLFRTDKARYDAPGMREPHIDGKVSRAPMLVKHFGKCLSVEHWDETCRYYADHFPDPMKSKWENRKGKAIHTRSDFGRELYEWGPDLWKNGVKL